MEAAIHPLRRWLFERQTTLAQFGAAHNIAQSALSEWINWKKYPSMEMMLRVAEATGGVVQPNDFRPVPFVAAMPASEGTSIPGRLRRLKRAARVTA